MRTLTLRLQIGSLLTGRRPKPPIPDTDLTALKEQARQILQASTTPNPADLADLAPVPTPRRVSPFSYGPTPPPVYDPARSKVQAMVKTEPFGSEPTGEKRPGIPEEWPSLSSWERACSRLTSSERAWSSRP